MAGEYINMVKLLFENVEACVCFNGSIIKSFKIERGIKYNVLALHPCWRDVKPYGQRPI